MSARDPWPVWGCAAVAMVLATMLPVLDSQQRRSVLKWRVRAAGLIHADIATLPADEQVPAILRWLLTISARDREPWGDGGPLFHRVARRYAAELSAAGYTLTGIRQAGLVGGWNRTMPVPPACAETR